MFDIAALMTLVVAAAFGAGAMFAAPHIGINNAFGFGLVVGGAVAAIFSWQQRGAGTRNSILFVPCWAIGLAAILAGILGFTISGNPFSTEITAEQQKRVDGIADQLKRKRVSGKDKPAQDLITKYQSNLVTMAKKNLGDDKVSLYGEIKEIPGKHEVVIFVYSPNGGAHTKDGIDSFLGYIVQSLQTDYPKSYVAAALRGPSEWRGWAFANPGKPRRTEVDAGPPDF